MMQPGGVAIVFALALGLSLHTLEAGRPCKNGYLEPGGERTNSTCNIKCDIKRQYLDISFYKVNDHSLKNYLYVCETGGTFGDEIGECVLDLLEVTKDTPKDFVATAAVLVKCLLPAEIVIVNPTGIKMKTISLLEMRGCAVKWSSIATFGRAVGLRGLRLYEPLYVTNDLQLRDFKPAVIPINHIFPPIRGFDKSKYTLSTMVAGLHTLGKLEIHNLKPCRTNSTYLHCLSACRNVFQPVNLPSIFKENIWPEMAEVVLADMKLSSEDIAPLQRTMPFLQSLNILRNTGRFESFPEFPWCKSNMFLPLAMSRTESGTERYNEGANIPQNLYRRFFILEFASPQPATRVTFEGALDKVVLRNTIVDFGANPPSPFEGAFGLQILLLTNNRIARLPDHALHGNSGIKQINLTNNFIMDVGSKVFRGHSALRLLSIAKNRIGRLAPETFANLTNLDELDLSFNRITFIQSGTFKTLKKLKKLSLNDNLIYSIEVGALPDTRKNVLLQLYLQNNRLKTLTPDIVLFPFASRIDLSNNGITSRDFMRLLMLVDRKYMNDVMTQTTNHSDYEAVLFSVRGSGVVLSLSNNLIDNIDTKSLDSPESKALEWFLSYFLIDLTGNPLKCDCSVYPWYSLIQRHRTYHEYESYSWLSFGKDKWVCTEPFHLKGRPLEAIKVNEFACPFTGTMCPEPCECFDRLINDVTLVQCHGKNLTTLPEVMPEGLLEIHFEDNQITQIPPRPYLCNVTGLHMARNNIENITDDIIELLAEHADQIHLQENKIVRITKNVTTLLNNVTEFNLLQNDLVCNCSSIWLSDWLSQADYLVRAGDIKCTVGNEIKPLSSLTSDDFDCPVPAPKVQVIAGIAAGVILLLLLVGVFLPAILKGRKKKDESMTLRTVL